MANKPVSDIPETIPAEHFVPDHEPQLVQGPITGAIQPVTESESNIADLTRHQIEHPELQQMATMSGGIKQIPLPHSFVAPAANTVARGIIQKAIPIAERIPVPPSPRPDWMSQNPSAADAGTRYLQNINPGFKKFANGGDVPSESTPNTEAPETIPADQFVSDEEKYGTPGQQLKTAAEHAASSATFGLSTKAETSLGVNPEDIQRRTEENPVSAGVGSIAGLLVPGAPEAKALTKAGELGAKLVRGSSTLSKIGAGAVKGAIENTMFQGGDEVSKQFSQDPNQSAQTAITDIGLSGLIGGAFGAGFGAVSPLFEKTKASKFVDEMKSRLNEHLTNPDLPTQAADNLDKFYTDTTKGSDSLFKGSYDETGSRVSNVKDQAIEKLVPQMNDTILDKGIGEVTNHFADKLEQMKSDSDTFQPKFTKALEKDFTKWREVVDQQNATSADIFKATEDLKRSLQERSRIGIPIDNSNPAFDSIKSLKDSANYLRKSLENTDVWGDAGNFQKQVNEAYSKFQNPLKEFNRGFTTVLEGKPTLDPDKVNTYINQASRDKGSIRGEKLQNYLDAADKYRDAINEAHESIGVAGPFETRSADAANTLTKSLTPGAKAADSLVKGIMSHSGGDTAGAVGGVLGGWPGYMVGKHIAGPVLDSVLPSLMKPLLGSATNGTGLKHALDFIGAFSKGETAINRGVKNIFKAGKEVIPASLMPTEKDRNRLDTSLKNLSQNPTQLSSIGGSTSHYLPDHGMALAHTTMNAINFLNSQKPQSPKVSPLDTPSKPDPMAQSQYTRILNIAQQPLVILKSIKEGSIQPNDVKAITSLYPDLYNKLSQKLITEISSRKEDSEPIPYRTKMGMSIFLGKAMDSTMLPESIIAAQPQQPQAPESTQKPSKKPAAANAKVLEKNVDLAQTPAQARANYRQQARA